MERINDQTRTIVRTYYQRRTGPQPIGMQKSLMILVENMKLMRLCPSAYIARQKSDTDGGT